MLPLKLLNKKRAEILIKSSYLVGLMEDLYLNEMGEAGN